MVPCVIMPEEPNLQAWLTREFNEPNLDAEAVENEDEILAKKYSVKMLNRDANEPNEMPLEMQKRRRRRPQNRILTENAKKKLPRYRC